MTTPDARDGEAPESSDLLQTLLRFRYVYMIAVVFTLINSVIFLLAGARQSFEGWISIYRHLIGQEAITIPKLPLLESLDSFLIALVFLIFSLGIMKIFIGYQHSDAGLPSWLRIHDFKELKVLLWETILVTLVVMSMGTVARNFDALTWQVLVSPVIVLVLAVGLFLMRGREP
jgi:uncharacterized membrane protein YqhA